MAELVTWSPRVGAVGDDLYRWPEELFQYGGAVAPSDPPSLTNVNGLNRLQQMIAEWNRRWWDSTIYAFTNKPKLLYFTAEGLFSNATAYNATSAIADLAKNAVILYSLEYQATAGINSGINTAGVFTAGLPTSLLKGDTALVGACLGLIRKLMATDYYAAFRKTLETQELLCNTNANVFLLPGAPVPIAGYSNGRSNYQAASGGRRARTFQNFKIPATMPSISALKIVIPGASTFIRGDFTTLGLEIWKCPVFGSFAGNGNWAISDTAILTGSNLLGTLSLNSPVGVQTAWVNQVLSLTSASFSPGDTFGITYVVNEERSTAHGAGHAANSDSTLDSLNGNPILLCYP